MKTKRSIYNLISGFAGQLITMALGIVIPRLFLVNLGSEANGLMSSVHQIFVYFALLEAGVGLATTQALYKPVATDDKNKINAILAATDRYYKRTGVIYLICVLALAVIYPLVTKTEIDFITIVIVIILQGLGGVITYFFQGKYRMLLTAEGKGYFYNNLDTFLQVSTSLAKIVLLTLGFNVIAIQVSYFIINIIRMLIITIYVKKHYKWIDLSVPPDKKAISQKNFVLVHQIAGMVFGNTDVLILTIFCGLKVVSVYTIYNLVFSCINTMMSIISQSSNFQLGQALAVDKNKFVRMFDIYETYYTAFNFSLSTAVYIFILPFITLYTKGVTDINYLDNVLPILFVSISLLTSGKLPSNLVINVAGHFKQTARRCVYEALINIGVSIACVYIFGLRGVLVGTIVALIYRANDMIIYANKKIIGRSPKRTYMRWGINLCLFFGICYLSKLIPWNNSNYLMLVINAGISFILIISIFFGVNTLIEHQNAKYLLKYIKGSIREVKNKRMAGKSEKTNQGE